ncbi:glycosyl hydrolase [Paenibacillus farraposensis]|uniref:Glycosyl hydrolase n=2 Tax=Paenibacillus farraposensis TaxID=2807095 RepID=A0ABW4D6Y9_9BACL|nr:glycosyl hydrolase [Paenibacillus farraposensis]MCC3382054.1 glycosyl hydrolase [Paenibacillus farraposensis]
MRFNFIPLYRLMRYVILIVMLFSLLPVGFGESLSVVNAASLQPVNSDASAQVRGLYNYLLSISGKKTVTGQHDYLESPDELSSKVQKISQAYVGIHGYEMGAISGQSAAEEAEQRKNVVDSAIRWSRAGGIVTMTFHEALPGSPLTWANVQAKVSQTEFNKYVTPGTTQYNLLVADLDKVAESLKQLRDAGVPVLWRPYHEMNGDWFWWGNKDNFNQLWSIMYDRLANTHQLNNLLWVWSPNAPNSYTFPYTPKYPGDDKVDILAVDIYNNDFKQSHYDDLLELARNKPIAIGEHGEMPSSEVLQAQPNWVYSMTWGKMLTENNTTDQIQEYMNDSRSLTRDDVKLGLSAIQQPATDSPPLPDNGQSAPAPVPPVVIIPPPAPPSVPDTVYANGLRGEYFNNMNLGGSAALIRLDSKLDYNWRAAAADSSLNADQFSVRWIGKIKPQYSETYTFTTISDDGIRVWVDGKLIIDSWFKQSWTERKGSIALQAGKMVELKVEYYDDKGDAMARLMWESQHEGKAVVPGNALFLP